MKRKAAQWIRIISLPAILALLLFCCLYASRPELFTGSVFGISLISIVLVPLLPYPVSSLWGKNPDIRREKQRSLAFVLTLLGHTTALVFGYLVNVKTELILIYWTYFLSIVVLFVFNKLLHIRASAHGAGMAGAFFLMPWLLGPIWCLPCAVIVAAVCWSSIILGRHTGKELVFGGCCGGISFLISLAITAL